jgi:macrophage erythroblast attacher
MYICKRIHDNVRLPCKCVLPVQLRIALSPCTLSVMCALQAGLTALKCPLSFEEGCTKEDPMHLPEFRALAKDLPWAKHVTSKVVCAISKSVMDDSNPPMVLPNSYVYSRNALEKMACENDGEVVCPVTGESFIYDGEVSQAYLM